MLNALDNQRELLQLFNGKSEANAVEDSMALSDEPFRDLEWYYADNGFCSRQAMEREHEPIVNSAAAILGRSAGNVLDLGCGNGVLLKKICYTHPNLIPWGVDHARIKITRARLLNPQFADNFVVADVFDDCVIWSEARKFQLVLLMLGRLTEVPEARVEKLLKRIKEQAGSLLVYVYDGYECRCGSIRELAQKTGVNLSHKLLHENVATVDLK
jgi:hypothetical protein